MKPDYDYEEEMMEQSLGLECPYCHYFFECMLYEVLDTSEMQCPHCGRYFYVDV